MNERNDPAPRLDDSTDSSAADTARESVGTVDRVPHWLATITAPRNALPLLMIATIALYLVNLGGYPLYTKGEPREAVTIYDIVHGGGWILPARAGIEIPSKPLLMHWLAALLSLVTGVTEFSVRLPTAALGIAGVLVCYFYGRRLIDNVSAFFAALIMGTTAQYLQAATGARVDMTLTFFMEVAFFEFILMAEGLTRRRMLFYVAIACAILTKGPVGGALPVIVAIIWIALKHRWSVVSQLALVRGAIVVIVLAGGWYLGALIEGGAGFFRKQILAENLYRVVASAAVHEPHAHPFYYMEGALLAGLMPWTIVAPIAIVEARRRPRTLDSRLSYFVIWFVAVLVFYNLPQSKRGVYLLALYPALAMLFGIYLADAIVFRDAARRWISSTTRVVAIATVIAAAGALSALAILARSPELFRTALVPFDIEAPAFLTMLTAAVNAGRIVSIGVPIVALAIGVWLALSRAAIERLVLGMGVTMILIALAANVVVVPAIADTLSLKNFTIEAMKEVGGDPCAYLDALNYDVAFYSGRSMPIVRARDKSLPGYLICWRAYYFGSSAALRDQYEIILTSNPTSLDGSDEMVLLKRRPAPVNPETHLA
jgi:4-amino-4-deoxy-L-arabinose transferase-like glycosyltransferase